LRNVPKTCGFAYPVLAKRHLFDLAAISFCGSKNIRQDIINGPFSLDRTLPFITSHPLHSPSFMPAPNRHSSRPTVHHHTSSRSPLTFSHHFIHLTLALRTPIPPCLLKLPQRYKRCWPRAWIVWLPPLIPTWDLIEPCVVLYAGYL
jgi:hypothetical protein